MCCLPAGNDLPVVMRLFGFFNLVPDLCDLSFVICQDNAVNALSIDT